MKKAEKAEKLKKELEEMQRVKREEEEKSEKEEGFKLDMLNTEKGRSDACMVTVEGVEDVPTDNSMGVTDNKADTEDMF